MELLNYVMICVKLFWRELTVAGAVMVSSIIAVMGILKPVLFNRIHCKALRKSVLAFGNVFLSFIATAFYFLIRPVDRWDLYWIASLITSIACIVTYWLYENTHLREAIHKLGNLAIDKGAKILKMIVNGNDSKDIDAEIKKATSELKATAKAELKSQIKKSYKKDKDLKNV